MNPRGVTDRGGTLCFVRTASPEAVRAVVRLEHGLERIAQRGAITSMRLKGERQPQRQLFPASGRPLSPERDSETARLLGQWARRVRSEGGHLEAVLDLLIDGASFASVDRRWRRRNGWARAQLGRAVDLFVEMNRGAS